MKVMTTSATLATSLEGFEGEASVCDALELTRHVHDVAVSEKSRSMMGRSDGLSDSG